MNQLRKGKYCLFLIFALFATSLIAQDYAHLVDTKIGNANGYLGSGKTFPGAAFPFGMVQFTPTYWSPNKGFVINQLDGPGCANLGHFPVLPISGSLEESPDNMDGYEGYSSVNDSHAGYFSVNMPDGTKADLTANKRSGIARFTFNETSNMGTVILGSGASYPSVDFARVEITSKNTMEGFADGAKVCGRETNMRVYFAVEFNKDAQITGTWNKKALLENEKTAYGINSGAFFTFNLAESKEVTYRISISYVSIENAKENLADESQDSFEKYKSIAVNSWNNHLDKIKVTSSNQDRKKQFYTHLYHALIHPNIVNDVNGDYMGADFKVHTAVNRDAYSTFSAWDTYRTQAQLLAMLFPEKSSEMIQSLVEFAEHSGGYGRWILLNRETGIMQGDPIPILIANSYAFGAKNFDLEKAYSFMKKAAITPQIHSQNYEIRPHLAEYIKDGYTKASLMLEYTSGDFAIGQFALKALNNEKDAIYFTERAQNWKNIYNPENNWLNSRYPNGKWKDIKQDWVEGTYKNYFWMVPYNLSTLIDTIGGKDYAEQRLDTFFTRLDDFLRLRAHHNDDWFVPFNEPDFQIPWIYNWTNSPNKSSAMIHRIFDEMFNSTPSGLPDNDDVGALGAWYVFGSIGLYPMIPGVGGFTVNIPQFKSIKIELPDGELLITGGGGGVEKPYINSLVVNKSSQTSSWIPLQEIEKGGSIIFKTSKKLNKNWGTKNGPPPSYESINPN